MVGITVDGGIMVVVVIVMVMGVLKGTPGAQNILVFIWLVYYCYENIFPVPPHPNC